MIPRKVIQGLSVLVLFSTLQAHADDAICNNVNFEIHKLSDPDRIHANSVKGVNLTYEAALADGFLYGDKSGISFKENKMTAWGRGDLLVIHPSESKEQVQRGEKNPTKFFIQYDEAPYNGPNDKGTKGGIYKVQNLEDGSETGVVCSKEASSYEHHFFPSSESSPEVGAVYCVRTRDGKGYALMRVSNVCSNGVIFSYKYNGTSNAFKGDEVPAKPRIANLGTRLDRRGQGLRGRQ